jgi:hypothetical protein
MAGLPIAAPPDPPPAITHPLPRRTRARSEPTTARIIVDPGTSACASCGVRRRRTGLARRPSTSSSTHTVGAAWRARTLDPALRRGRDERSRIAGGGRRGGYRQSCHSRSDASGDTEPMAGLSIMPRSTPARDPRYGFSPLLLPFPKFPEDPSLAIMPRRPPPAIPGSRALDQR